MAWLSLPVWAAVVAGCSGGSGGGSPGTGGPAHVVSGAVVAGPVSGATVRLALADGQGRPGEVLATASSGSDGRYSLSLGTLPTGALVVTATGGTYISEADGTSQAAGTLSVLLGPVSGSATTAYLSPASTLQAERAARLLAAGGTTVPAALDAATASLEPLLGSWSLAGQAVSAVSPEIAATAGASHAVAVTLGVLEQLGKNLGVSRAALVTALAQDLSDGVADGLAGGTPVALGGGVLPATAATLQLAGAAGDYARSTISAHAAAGVSTGAQAALIGARAAAGAAARGDVGGVSGGIATMKPVLAGVERHFAFFAAREDGLVRLDIGAADAAQWTADALTSLNAAIRPELPSVGGIVPFPAPLGGKPVLLLFDPAGTKLVLVDVDANTVLATASANIAATARVDGVDLKITGGSFDVQRRVLWLATADGLLALDPLTLAETGRIAQPVGTLPGPALGVDTASGLVLSPDPLGRGAVMFGLADRLAYRLDEAAWAALPGNQWRFDAAAGGPVACTAGEVAGGLCALALDRPVSAALDTVYQVAVMGNGSAGRFGLMAYETPGGVAQAFTARAGRFAVRALPGGIDAAGAVAVDSRGHHVLALNGFAGGNLVVGRIADPAGAVWAGFSSLKAVNSAYVGVGGAQAVAATGVAGGGSFGFALQQGLGGPRSYRLMAVDLAAFLAAPASATGVLLADPLDNPVIVRRYDY